MTNNGIGPQKVQTLFAEGVSAVQNVAARLTDDLWTQPACGSWSAADTARHLLGVSAWYHEWLDRSLDGATTAPFPAAEIDAQNAAALAELLELSGPDAIDAFVDSATAYLERVTEHWDAPYEFPFGSVTAGLHCGVAATEWNLHAWDVSTVAATPHAPAHPDRLFMAAGACFAAAEGGIKGQILSRIVPLAARRRPWESLLARSGRSSAA